MRLLFENWRAFLQEEDLLEEGLWDTVKSDVSAVFMGIKPDATIGYLLDKLRSTSAIKNLKGDSLVKFLQISKKIQRKGKGALPHDDHSARQIAAMSAAALQNPDKTLEYIIQNISMKHARTPEERKEVVMKGLNSFLGNFALFASEFQKAEPRPGLAEDTNETPV